MATAYLCSFETDKACACCQQPGRMAWGALCAECEDLVADFTPEEWAYIETLTDVEAARYILSGKARLQMRYKIAEARGLCVWSDLPSDECPHCTGNLTGFEVECEHGNNAFGCRLCAVPQES